MFHIMIETGNNCTCTFDIIVCIVVYLFIELVDFKLDREYGLPRVADSFNLIKSEKLLDKFLLK